jgi:hypothetical protein
MNHYFVTFAKTTVGINGHGYQSGVMGACGITHLHERLNELSDRFTAYIVFAKVISAEEYMMAEAEGKRLD